MNPTGRKLRSAGAASASSVARAVAAAALTLVVLQGCIRRTEEGRGDLRPLITELGRDMQKTMRRDHLRGLAIALVDKDASSWTAAFGSAGGERPLTSRTPMNVGSVTKLFTAVAVMQLVERGLVDLDAPVGRYITEMEGIHYLGAPEPTVRDLLTHHAGLSSDFLGGTVYDGPASGYDEAFMDVVPLIAAEPPTEPPRLLAHYSNLGYHLLGALVARVSGRPYVRYVKEEILRPLGMRTSGFYDPRFDEVLSRGFAKGKEVGAQRMTGLPEGGLSSSAEDLARFIRAILADGAVETPAGEAVSGATEARVLQAPTLREMLRRQNAEVALDFDFEMGLGFRIMSLPGYPDIRVAWHDGGLRPFAATLLVASDHGVGVALLSNTDERVPYDLAYRALARTVEVRTGRRLRHTRAHRFGRMPGRSLGPAELPGIYASEIGALSVSGRPARATVTMNGKTLHLVPREQRSYGLQARLAGLLPLPIAALRRIQVVFREIDGTRVAAIYESGMFRSVALAIKPEPVPDAWLRRCGAWSVRDLDRRTYLHRVGLAFDQSLRMMTLQLHVTSEPEPLVLPALPRGEDTLVIAGLGRHMGQTLRVANEAGVERIHLAGIVLERQ